MARRIKNKKIRYLRAARSAAHEGASLRSLEQLLRHCIPVLTNVASREIQHPSFGTLGIRHWRDASEQAGLFVKIAGGALGEAASTYGVGSHVGEDDDRDQPPPTDRAYKNADAFMLVSGNETLICCDGGIRPQTVEALLTRVLTMAGIGPEEALFQLRPVQNADKTALLEREGVKAVMVTSVLRRATVDLSRLEGRTGASLTRFLDDLAAVFVDTGGDEAAQEQIAAQYSEINVVTTISAKGGSHAQDLVLESLEHVALDLDQSASDQSEVVLVTKKGTEVSPEGTVLFKPVRFRCREGSNDLLPEDVETAMISYRRELQTNRLWNT